MIRNHQNPTGNLIVVAGHSRSGTSLMMQCLKYTGYYLGEKDELSGGFFLCENKKFNELNKKIGRGGRVPSVDAKRFLKYVRMSRIQALKAYAPALKYWLKYDEFKNAKYIRTVRTKHNIIDSWLARHRGKSRKDGEAFYEEFENHLKCLNYSYCVLNVHFESMHRNPKLESDRIAKFLGIPHFSTKPLNPDLWHFVPHETD